MSNTALWDRLGKTDPAHTKSFKRAGGFSGTAIKPTWSYRRMTEEFGPCGQGWGIGEPSFQVVPGPEGEMLVYCTASVWYRADDGEPSATVYGVGGDKAVGKNKWGLSGDDEAFKKAFTDAITNALKMIGVGADVHMGMFDDSKYVNALREEFAEEKQPSKNEASRAVYSALEAAMRQCTTKAELKQWIASEETKAQRAKIPADWDKSLRQSAADFGKDLPDGHEAKADIVTETVEHIQDTFPGSRVINDTRRNEYLDNYSAG